MERRNQGRKEKMPTVWTTLKRSLHCKSEPSEVYEPKAKGQHVGTTLTGRPCRSGCSRSIANLKDVIHGGRRDLERPASCSPRSIGSSDLLNPITHEVVLSDSMCELKIVGLGGGHEGGTEVGSAYVGTLRPGTPGPARGGHHALSHSHSRPSGHAFGASSLSDAVFGKEGGGSGHQVSSGPRASYGVGSQGPYITCHRCVEQFGKWEALEAHHLSRHAVTELVEGDSSRKIVEIICKASSLKSESGCGRLERVLKVHNVQRTLARFEEYREMVKIKASKLPKKHPRCLADGNELLRFYSTTVSCSLGMDGSSDLCPSDECNVCRIIRYGFSTKKDYKGGIGVFTTANSGRALESVEVYEDDTHVRTALMVCRVIAGRVHKPMDNIQNMVAQTGFDSVAGKVGPHANIEELYLLNPRAVLPCFLVICKQ